MKASTLTGILVAIAVLALVAVIGVATSSAASRSPRNTFGGHIDPCSACTT